MLFLTNLLISFTCNFCDFGGSVEEAPEVKQASILQRVEPGLLAVYDTAKTTIKE